MGGKSSPDYSGAAVAQGEANREVVRDQTFANRPDQYTPWGATSWTPYQATDPATGEATTAWSQTQSLTPELQDILNKQIAIQSGRSDVAGALTGRMGAEFTQPMDWRGLNPMGEVPTQQYTIPEEVQRNVDYSDIPMPTAPGQVMGLSTEGLSGINGPQQVTGFDTSGIQGVSAPQQQTGLDYSGIGGVGDGTDYRARAEQSIYDKGASRLGDQFETRREQMEIKLRNQGLRPGDAAYDAQVQSIDQQETDAYGQLQNDAIMGGMSEANQAFNQDMSRRNLYTGERDRQAQFANDSQRNLFDMQSNLRGQQYGENQTQAQFANDANTNMFNMQSGLRGQMFGERQTQGQFTNDAAQNLYGMQSDLRNMYTGERDRNAAFYNAAGQQSYNQALGANQQNYQQAMAGSQYANQIRQQQITEAMTKRGFSLNEINALLSGQQVNTPQMPNFQGASAAQAAPIYQGAVDQGNYNAGMSPWNALLGAGGSVVGAAGAAGGFSTLFS